MEVIVVSVHEVTVAYGGDSDISGVSSGDGGGLV